jgi:Peptidase family M48
MRSLRLIAIPFVILFFSAAVVFGEDHPQPKEKTAQQAAETQADEIAGRIFYREAKLIEDMKPYTPMVETYIQNFKANEELGQVPSSDRYFLGRMVLKNGIENVSYQRASSPSILQKLDSFYKMNYVAQGFMQMVYIPGFDKNNYDLKYLHQEFLGEIRTLVFDVSPKPRVKGPHFLGRIWVEDQDYTMVRFNGTYVPQRQLNFFFHFDAWRINLRPGLWLPAFIYTEESDARYALFRRLAMRGQTRLWGYNLKLLADTDEFTSVQVDSASDISDQTDSANEIEPVESEHKWEREAEDDVLDRLQRAGLLAPDGDVSKVLETVINNLEITNKLNIQPEVRARVLLTTPLESFTVGHTIVISRGLLDVLPDEASLAMVLAHELGHIALGHRLDTKYAFGDRMVFPDEDTLTRIQLARDPYEEEAADKKAVEFLQNSPYKDKLPNAGLFLRALQARSKELPSLITPQFGARMAKGQDVVRMSALLQSAPALQTTDLAQIAALPLGSRIKLDPWDDTVELKKNKPVALQSARDKMAFEVTPMIPHLARYRGAQVANAAGTGK